MRLSSVTATAILVGTLAFAAPALADDGVMQRIMGHEAYAAMVEHMRGVLGEQRATEMLAECEAAMASHEAESPGIHHMDGMMRMHRTHGGS